MKPKIKEILFDAFAVICFLVGFSIHGVPSLVFLLAGSICGAFALFYTLSNNRIHGVTNSQSRNWAWLFFAVSFIGLIIFWQQFKQSENSAESNPEVWQPPELSSDCTTIWVTFFGWNWKIPISELAGEKPYDIFAHQGTPEAPDMAFPINQMFKTNTILIRLKNNRIFVDDPIDFDRSPTLPRNPYMNIGELDNHLRAGWDRNFDANAFEMVDQFTCPMCQIVYNQPNHIVIGGIFEPMMAMNNRLEHAFINGERPAFFSFGSSFGVAMIPMNAKPFEIYTKFTNYAVFQYPFSEWKGKRRN